VPYAIRSILLGLTLVVAFFMMKDLGFTPQRGKSPLAEMRRIARASLDSGLRNPPVRWLMLAAPFTTGVGIYAFYALQPYLLQLYGDRRAFGVAGLAAAIIAGTQMLSGVFVPVVRRLFSRRTDALLVTLLVTCGCMAVIGLTTSFAVAVGTLVIWGLAFSLSQPMRQAYLNGLIPSAQRATVLSFDNLIGSAGGVVTQPVLGRVADVWGYPASYLVSAVLEGAALPFLLLARRENAPSDRMEDLEPPG
jgi:MFS family permease